MRTETPSVVRFLDRLRGRLPEVFLEGWEGLGGRGDRLLGAVASVFGRVLDNVRAELDARLIMRASEGVRASGRVYVRFTETTVHGFSLAAGNVLFTTPAGTRYRLVNAWTRAASAAAGQVSISVEAEYVGTHGNRPPRAVNQWAVTGNDALALTWVSTTTDGMAEFMDGIRDESIYIDVPPDGADEIEGGLPASIDLRAAGRGLPRGEGEATRDLRHRIRTIPEAVTPAGIERAVAAALSVDVSEVEVSEYWEHGFAWGVSGWGLSAWSQRLLFYVIVPSGSPVASIQSLVDRIKPAGVHAIVIERAP